MSSKTRRKAREWMQKERQHRNVEYRKGFDTGASYTRDDMRRLLPDQERQHDDAGRMYRIHVISRFPDPYQNGPYFRVPISAPVPRLFSDFDAHRHGASRFVDFVPIENALTWSTPDADVSLRWFSWEPRDDEGDGLERSKALITTMGRLGKAEFLLSTMALRFDAHPDAREALACVTDVRNEIRRRLGNYAPERHGHWGRL